VKRINVAVFGTGFMGRVHTEALRRLGNINVVAVAGTTADRARAFADDVSIETSTGNWRELLDDTTIDAVHIGSPTGRHYEMAMAAMDKGKAVLCEKPLANTVEEGRAMAAKAVERNVPTCVLYNMRNYPQVAQMRAMCQAGDLGDIRYVQGTYSQDWLFLDTDWNWRIEEGTSRTFADIGTHWCDMAEYITGKKITSLCADLETFLKERKKPHKPAETYQGKDLRPDEYTLTPIKSEDWGSMIFELGDTARGCVTFSQIAVGRKNRLFMEVFGTKSSVAWSQETPDELWIGHRDRPSEILLKDSVLYRESARSFADLPGGHSEGYDDTFKQTFRRFYAYVADRSAPIEFPTFEDGIHQLQLVDTVLASSAKHGWKDVE
jgi:predicted dehydrogenase